MKINPYIQVQQIYGASKVSKMKKTAGVSGAKLDGVEISGIGRDIQTAKQAVAAAPDVRSELTDPIKARIDSGNYSVDGESFADKLWRLAGEQ